VIAVLGEFHSPSEQYSPKTVIMNARRFRAIASTVDHDGFGARESIQTPKLIVIDFGAAGLRAAGGAGR
jgi:hypothetical protein